MHTDTNIRLKNVEKSMLFIDNYGCPVSQVL